MRQQLYKIENIEKYWEKQQTAVNMIVNLICDLTIKPGIKLENLSVSKKKCVCIATSLKEMSIVNLYWFTIDFVASTTDRLYDKQCSLL